MSIRHLVYGASALMGLAAFAVQPALAQTSLTVTVTAQKRAEDVQDIPMSITAYSGEFLESKGLDSLAEISTYTPNFKVETGNNPRNSSVRIRGVGSSAQNAGVEASVGTFVDGVYVPRIGALLGSMSDILTVEVLKGPQGTLYGRNTAIGALNINTRPAGPDFEAKVKTGFGNYDQREFSGYINGGITDSLFARVSLWMDDSGGTEKNLVSGTGWNNRENFGGRTKFLWEASDATDVNLILDYAKQVTQCCTADYAFVDLPMINSLNQAAIGTGVSLAQQLVPHQSARDRIVAQGGNQNNEDEQWGAAVVLTHDFQGGGLSDHTFKSVTAYRKWDNNGNFSQGDTVVNFQSANQTQVERTLSQEFNLSSPDGGVDFLGGTKVEYILGAFFLRQVSNATTGTTFEPASLFLPGVRAAAQSSGLNPGGGAFNCNTNFPGSAGCPFVNGAVGIGKVTGPLDFNDWNQRARSYAFFGQGTVYLIPDVWSVTGGLRYSKDKKKTFMDSTFLIGQRGASATAGTFSAQFNNIDYATFPEEDAITWLASTKYHLTEDIMFYFTSSTGYKSPGASSRPYRRAQAAAGQPVGFGSEQSINFEVGAKTEFFNNRLLANVAIYRTKLDNFQQSVQDPTLGPGAFLTNFGTLRQQGVEADFRAQPYDWLEIDGAVAFLDSQWVDFATGPCAQGSAAAPSVNNLTAYVPGTTFCNYNGLPTQYSPKWTSHIGAKVTFPLLNTALEWFASGDWSYNGSFYSDEALDKRSRISKYNLFDASVGLQGNDGNWKLTAWIKNLANQVYYTSKTNAAGAAFFQFGESRRWFYQPPRTLGLRGEVTF